MIPRSSDYLLGESCYQQLSSYGSIDSNRLKSILVDLAAADVALASAFTLLLSHPIFVNLISSRTNLSSAQLSSLHHLAQDSLAPQLALRIIDFLAGFSSRMEIPSFNLQQDLRQHHEIPPTIVADDSIPSSTEPPTLFAPKPESANGQSNDFLENQKHAKGSATRYEVGAYLKPMISLLSIAIGLTALFKVETFCKPLGLCETSRKSRSTGSSTDPQPSASSPKQAPPKSSRANFSYPKSPPVHRQSNYSQTPTPPTYSPPPQPSQAPDRDVPLW